MPEFKIKPQGDGKYKIVYRNILLPLWKKIEDMGKKVSQEVNDQSEHKTIVPTGLHTSNRGKTVHFHSNTIHQIQEMFGIDTKHLTGWLGI